MVLTSSVIGGPVPRLEGPDKVSGRALYAADIQLPGMLWCKVLRSPYPHAKIISIDTERAQKVPGVRAVITGKEYPGMLMGRQFRDMPVLCWDKVRFIGDRVAAVAAETRAAAEEAVALIDVEYEELPAVFDPASAMLPDAPRLHDDITLYDGGQREAFIMDVPNGLSRLTWSKGNIEQGFQEADLTFEHTFTLPSRHQGYLEPHAAFLAIESDGRIQVWLSTKSPFRMRDGLAKTINVPPETIRVNPVYVGGDFGGKGDAMDLPIAYLLAQLTGRPIKVVMTYAEELMAGDPSHPSVVTIRSGVNRDGRLVARYLQAVHATGAYAAFKPSAQGAIGGASHGGGPYRIDHAYFEAIQVYTNHFPCGFFRAPGATQVVYAVESHMDIIAQALGMDPVEFRMKNLLSEGDENAVGRKLREVKAKETLEAALEQFGWYKPKAGPNIGRGIAMFDRSIPGGPSGAVLTLNREGHLAVLSPTFDQGVGTHTILSQIVAHELQVPLAQISVAAGNTDNTPYDAGVGGSRVTNVAGQAVVRACELLLEQLFVAAAPLLGSKPEEMQYGQGRVWVKGQPNRSLEIGEVADSVQPDGQITVTSTVNIRSNEEISCFCAQIAEVSVDPETGQVRVQRFVTAHDVGTVINSLTHQGQIDGGVVQGLGVALMEELGLEDGRVTTPHLGEYKLPTIADIPPLETVLVYGAGGPAPYEGKAIGEMANVAPAAAIANAVADAVGVRLFTLPLTSERIYKELTKARGEGKS